MAEKQESAKFRLVQLRQLFCLLLANFLQNTIVSINGPLYPPEAEARGLNAATYGIVLSFFRAVLIFFIFLFGTQVERFGLKRMFVWCVFINGLSPILFGFITYVESGTVFLVLSFILRGLEGIGAAGIIGAIYMFPGLLFPGYVSPVFGVIQTFFAASTAVGPLLGTLIDSSYGFTVTYVFFGFLDLVAGILVTITVPSEPPSNSVNKSGRKNYLKGYWALLKFPSVLISVYTCVVSGAVLDSVNAVLQPALEQYGLTEVGTGWMFFLMSVPQFAAPLWGFLIDRMDKPQLTVVAGALSTVLACIILGPFPGIPSSFPLLVAGLFLLGFSQGLVSIACICNFRLEVIRHAGIENMLNISFLSIAYGTSTSVGSAIGPLVSGLLYNAFGFADAMLFPIAINIILVILVVCQIICPGLEPSSNSTSVRRAEENDPLLSSN